MAILEIALAIIGIGAPAIAIYSIINDEQTTKAEKTKNIAILTAVMLIAAILGMLAWKCGGVSCLLH